MRARRAARALTVLLGAAAALAGGAASSAQALTVGFADNKPAVYADARLRALQLPVARLIVPYDAAFSQTALVDQWLAAVAAAGMTPHVAFEHLKTDRCPGSPCTIPSRATYAADVRAFIARWPQVRTYTTWNEANHEAQSVSNAPERVAGYYEELVAACPGCTIVAGDVLDSGGYVNWLRRFEAATTLNPQLWGLHNYGDVTYGTTTGTDNVLATVPGRLWIEETGGIVVLRNQTGRQTLPYDETRAAESIDQAFAIAEARPRIDRMYLYHWSAPANGGFDAGLVRPDNTLRPSYDEVVKNLATLRASAAAATAKAATATATVAKTLRVTVAWSTTAPRVLLVKVRCLTSGGRCTGRVTPAVRTRAKAGATTRVARLTTRSYTTRNSARTVTLRYPVTKAVRTRVKAARTRRLAVLVRPTTPTGSPTTVTLRLAR